MSTSTTSTLERYYALSELTEAGLGSRPTLLKRIQGGEVPAYTVNGILKVRESDLHLLAKPLVVEAAGGDAA